LTVDRANLLLLTFAFAVAYIIPFELLLLSYAFLGPLHYLTEISWLHDRKYFTLLPEDPFYLVIGSFVLLFAGAAVFPSAAELVWILILIAFCTTFIRSVWKRVAIIGTGFILLLPWLGSTAS
jgi:4-hydroxybenzoate polyprenyltransferase